MASRTVSWLFFASFAAILAGQPFGEKESSLGAADARIASATNVSMIWTAPSSASKYAIVVGISKYSRSPGTSLRYAARDATDLADLLSTRGFGVSLFTEGQATAATLLHEITAHATV